jgi:hypothetical protein
MHRIDTTNPRERWRYECPECRKKDWRANNGNFECRACGAFPDGLVDATSEEFVPRERIEFVGPESSWKAPYAARREGD